MANSQTAHKEQQLAQVIRLLGDGDYHSGQKIADELGVSRAYVWKLIQQLQDYGLELESVSGKGYVWQSPSALINEESLRQTLAGFGLSLQLHLTTDSTNQRLKENFRDKCLVTAEYQTAGRGRRGRNWQSPLATNLYFSYGWKTELPVQQLGGLSLLVGISIVQALETLGFSGLKLKWPNDIRYQQKKLAGILVELTGDADGDLEVIIGVGLNVNMQTEQGSIEQDWISLAQIQQHPLEREQLLAAIMQSLVGNLSLFEANGFQFFAKAWNQYDEVINTQVTIHQAKDDIDGIAKGVDLSGALVLDVDGELQSIFAGDVSLRARVKS
ncbi:MAG: bifunctional biotin--[acetyl-CoA-carboxylase] ligase/biotin operon repressor BirA [Gammaproteobacteria bacterium]|nr:bifunctional biotin--[acetyl-CoA-carboxylase] ligase/biotin operon repressor BirA [Gammaproteobacteria bacterium]